MGVGKSRALFSNPKEIKMAKSPTTAPAAAAPKNKRQVMAVKFHQNRKTIFWIGGYRADGEGGSLTHPLECVINPGYNMISDPDIVAGLLKDSAFQESIAATEKQKRKGKKLQGVEIELFDAPAPKTQTKAEADADADDDEVPKQNMWEKVPPARMLDIIKDCVDVSRLEEMQKVETRANVSAALAKRITFLHKDAKNARDAVGREAREAQVEE